MAARLSALAAPPCQDDPEIHPALDLLRAGLHPGCRHRGALARPRTSAALSADIPRAARNRGGAAFRGPGNYLHITVGDVLSVSIGRGSGYRSGEAMAGPDRCR